MKTVVAWLSVILACALPAAWAEEGVPPVRDLHQDGAAARAIRGVVLLAVVADGCHYCETVLNDFLIPMSRNASYQERVVMRRVRVNGLDDVRDFDGKMTSPTEIADRMGTRFTPTIVLLDSDGNRLGKPLIGISGTDYYGYYLDQAIDAAIAEVRGEKPAN
jgi:thioredoxin-related protein